MLTVCASAIRRRMLAVERAHALEQRAVSPLHDLEMRCRDQDQRRRIVDETLAAAVGPLQLAEQDSSRSRFASGSPSSQIEREQRQEMEKSSSRG